MEAKSLPFQALKVVLIHVHYIYALPTVKHKKAFSTLRLNCCQMPEYITKWSIQEEEANRVSIVQRRAPHLIWNFG